MSALNVLMWLILGGCLYFAAGVLIAKYVFGSVITPRDKDHEVMGLVALWPLALALVGWLGIVHAVTKFVRND